MAGYAAAMDASMMEGSSSQDGTVVQAATGGLLEESKSQEGQGGADMPAEDWESQADELNHTSLSMCASEVNDRKNRGERSRSVATDSRFIPPGGWNRVISRQAAGSSAMFDLPVISFCILSLSLPNHSPSPF